MGHKTEDLRQRYELEKRLNGTYFDKPSFQIEMLFVLIELIEDGLTPSIPLVTQLDVRPHIADVTPPIVSFKHPRGRPRKHASA